MPQSLSHQADQKHALPLLPVPAYSEGSFQCNACGVLGTVFRYHCEECQLDLHPVCTFMRSTLKGGAHDHPLKSFEPPYENKAFICDVCGGSGSNDWLYRCDSRGFDAHLKCAKASNVQQNRKPQTDQKPAQSNSRNFKSPQPQTCKSKSVHFPEPYTFGDQSWRQLHRYVCNNTLCSAANEK